MANGYWERQLDFDEALPDLQTWRDRIADRSAAFSRGKTFARVAYGAHPRQWYETLITGDGEQELLPVFIHGGYWRENDAEKFRFVMEGLARFGPAQVNMEYRLIPEVRLDAIIDDAATGLRRIADETDSRLVVIGHSAGGHLAVAGPRKARLGKRIAAVVPIAGVFDLEPLQWSAGLQNDLAITPEEIANSPMRDTVTDDPPTLAVVGENETAEFRRQTEAFAARFGARVLCVPDTHHVSVLAPLGDPESPLTTAIADFARSGQ